MLLRNRQAVNSLCCAVAPIRWCWLLAALPGWASYAAVTTTIRLRSHCDSTAVRLLIIRHNVTVT